MKAEPMTQTTASLTPEQLKQLEQLKDIRLPDAVSWWPLAIGWWLLLVILVLMVALAYYAFRRRQRGVAQLALQELRQLPEEDIQVLSAQLSALIRRVARQRGDSQAMTLTGAAWVKYLSEHGTMPVAMARYLADAPYMPDAQLPAADALKAAVSQWIRRNA